MKQQGWKGWWRAAGVRAIKTMAQTAVATIGAAAVLCEVSWDVVGSAAGLAGGGASSPGAGGAAVPADQSGWAAGGRGVSRKVSPGQAPKFPFFLRWNGGNG